MQHVSGSYYPLMQLQMQDLLHRFLSESIFIHFWDKKNKTIQYTLQYADRKHYRMV